MGTLFKFGKTGGGGNDRFVTDEGEIITGRVARPEEESRDLLVAFVPHWKTCPNAGDFRRKRQEKEVQP